MVSTYVLDSCLIKINHLVNNRRHQNTDTVPTSEAVRLTRHLGSNNLSPFSSAGPVHACLRRPPLEDHGLNRIPPEGSEESVAAFNLFALHESFV
ncbi:hypothetical protein GUJ93_ZPchr0003g16498 [Zizania palustris]|uniref:Uncharacterized protein n=1 Tax=Zizania palustris TaxID=103762 RepID=A0A8J5S124_ZIZPA|nr:hypothetical protein GUJ93_ZPchr0003g16498 [Zizania palustris]